MLARPQFGQRFEGWLAGAEESAVWISETFRRFFKRRYALQRLLLPLSEPDLERAAGLLERGDSDSGDELARALGQTDGWETASRSWNKREPPTSDQADCPFRRRTPSGSCSALGRVLQPRMGIAMPRNIVIFSDGTGQRGGLLFDERRSNIYKLYRATRCSPNSSINPAEQLAYYDPGIGTVPGGLGFLDALGRKVYNIVSQATGLGLTRNIIDCYAAIIRMWQPGDRIFLFGFSRGAYTARCVAAVLALCGVPTRMKDGTPLRRDSRTMKKISEEAVKGVYQHVSSPNDTKYVPQRAALAGRFRAQYGSDENGKSNAYPHFIGVFDTVAAVANTGSLAVVAGLALVFIALVSGVLWHVRGSSHSSSPTGSGSSGLLTPRRSWVRSRTSRRT